MSNRKKFKLSQELSLRPSTPTSGQIDWSLCALCQRSTKQRLICPANSKRTDIGAGYDTLAANLTSFLSVDYQPLPVDIHRLDEGDGFISTLTQNKAQWHASCRLKCSSNRFARLGHAANKHSCSEASYEVPYMLRCKKFDDDTATDSKCFFCDEVWTKNAPLHEAMTPKITERVRNCALKVQDQKLIAKTSQ